MSKEEAKEIVQNLAMKFVEDYKKEMRNMQTMREEDIATAFYFGHCTCIKTMVKSLQDFIDFNKEEAKKRPSIKDSINMVIINMEALMERIQDFDLIETNEENENLN